MYNLDNNSILIFFGILIFGSLCIKIKCNKKKISNKNLDTDSKYLNSNLIEEGKNYNNIIDINNSEPPTYSELFVN